MASNRFGNIFTITTWGESHGKAIGVVIDGCPAGIAITEEEINVALAKRAPGKSAMTSPRKEPDRAEILSGVFEGRTTGAPISIMIPNRDADSSKYDELKDLYRPGHANFTYLEKYGIFDHRGGGRASARETACRVAASAVAKKLLEKHGISVEAAIVQIGAIKAEKHTCAIEESSLFCRDKEASSTMEEAIMTAKETGNSLGGVVAFSILGLPAGLGDPVYEKFEANLAKAMLSIPATKGFEIGSGFSCAEMTGADHNDPFITEKDTVRTSTNHAGGTLGGITTGMPVYGRVAFKPTSSIKMPQKTVTLSQEDATINLPEGSRHDPCVAIRAVPVVEAMAILVTVDALLVGIGR
ncbi:MAG: chorismate synthase [Chlamydiia bacterium]|nr:chorismate synthase [Chlamydiia bacterium]